MTVQAHRSAQEASQRVPADVAVQQTRLAGNPLVIYIESMPLTLVMFAAIVHRKFREWHRRSSVFQQVPVEDLEGFAAAEREVVEVGQQVEVMMVDCLVYLHHVIQARRDNAAELFTHHSVFSVPLFQLKWLCLTALDTPCAEAGGASGVFPPQSDR